LNNRKQLELIKNKETKTDFSSPDEIKQLDKLLKISTFRHDTPSILFLKDVHVQRYQMCCVWPGIKQLFHSSNHPYFQLEWYKPIILDVFKGKNPKDLSL